MHHFKRLATIIIATLSICSAQAAQSAHEHGNHADHMGNEQISSLPTEQGQGAFAAIAEIVALLQNDPSTDWSSVNIDALRAHLVDMQKLTIEAEAKTTVSDTAVIFTITGEGRTLSAIQNMVLAHAGVLRAQNILPASAEITPTGAVLQVAFTNETEKQKLLALGFYGIMATGAHHQEHHLAMARGQNVHQH